MVFEFIGVGLAGASVITIGESAGKSQNIIVLKHGRTRNQVVKVDNVCNPSSLLKSELRLFLAIEPIARHYYYLWFFACHIIFRPRRIRLWRTLNRKTYDKFYTVF